jgi:predicted ATPase/DNA-binding SARP family transcriptional activator
VYNVSVSRLSLAFFGAFQVTLGREPISHFRSIKNQGLLVYLALQSERPAPREVLAALFWPEEPDRVAHKNLRQALYQLRKLLGDLVRPDQLHLLITRQTAQFNSTGDYALDVAQFLEAIDARDLERAVSHYHDELLPGFTCDSAPFEDWLRREREYLHRLALEAMSELAQDHLRAGHLDRALALAQRQLSLEPWREPAHRQLMQALALAGDRASALAQYEACRRQLRQELDVEPDPETVALYEQIKTGRYGLIAPDETLPPPVKVRHNLPAAATPFFGRERELADISSLLERDGQRLVSIVGPGGIGKTRLALAVGRELLARYRDGVYLVDLAPLARPGEIGPAIAAALDYQAPDKTDDIFPQLLATLNRRHLLLILDNFEHLLAGGVALVNELLQACPDLAILVTSRQGLNLTAENRYPLGGLDVPESLTAEAALECTAVQLFVASGRRARPHFTLSDEDLADVIRICRLVQGVPLGLVLAAAWLGLLTPAEIAAEIEDSLDFLAADLADLPSRQHSMQAVFERSWRLLTSAERALLACLSVFRGGFTREAAEQVAGANLRLLLALVNKSLLQRQAGSGRFAMHELLRQFAARRRRRADPADQVAQAHSRYFARLADRETRRGLYFYPLHLPRRFAADRDNFHRAWDHALEYGRAQELSDMARGMVILTLAQGIHPAALCAQAIESLRRAGVPETDGAMLHLRLVELIALQGFDDPQRIKDLLLAYIPLAEGHSDPELRFWTYERIAATCRDLREPDAVSWADRAYEAARELEDGAYSGMSTAYRLWYRVDAGLQDDRTEAQLKELLAYFETAYPESSVVYRILQTLSAYYRGGKKYEEAVHYGTRGLNIAKQWRDLFLIGHSVNWLTQAYVRMGLPHEAGLSQVDGLEWHLAIGQTWQVLGFLWGNPAQYPQLLGGHALAVALMAMIYHHLEATSHYQAMISAARPRLEAQMGVEAYAAAWATGKELDFDTAVARVRAALSSAGA